MTTSVFGRLRKRLNQGESWLTYDVSQLLSPDGPGESAFEALEDQLIAADAGLEVTPVLVERLRTRLKQGKVRSEAQLQAVLVEAVTEILAPCERALEIPEAPRPFIVLVVGVNGVGKTTTIGKLATKWRAEGRTVQMAAGDTFRAAAAAQLRSWAERTGAGLTAQAEGADSASVIFDAIGAARARNVDLVIADTAGRQHTQGHLMDELRKVRRVIGKQDVTAPHETLLVVDATTGGNVLAQAREFHEVIGLTGIVMTKLDGNARGGTLLALARQHALPIRYIGLGESADDLVPFDAAAYARALVER